MYSSKLRPYKDQTLIKALIACILFSPLLYSRFFFDGFNISRVFLFSTLVLLFFSLLILKREHWKSEQISLDPICLFVFLFAVFEICYSLSLNRNLSKNIFFLTDVLLVVYLFILLKILRKVDLQNFLLYSCIILLAGCLLIGLLQISNIYPSYSDYFKVTGTFLNPGPFACLISVLLIIPVTILFFKEKLQVEKNHIFFKTQIEPVLVGLILLGVLILILTNVRASWFSLIVVAVVLVFNKRNYEKKFFLKKYFLILIGTSIAILIMLAFLFKRDSTDGRILIWKVSISNRPNSVLFGNGYEYFEHKYNTLQSSYFSTLADSASKEAKLAGNVSYAYNELIEIFINYGIVGVFFSLLLVYFVISSYHKNYGSNSLIYHISFYILLAIFLESLISYPFSMLGNKILFVTFLAVFFSHNISLKYKRGIILPQKYYFIFGLVSLLIFGFIATMVVKNIYAYKAWKEADRQFVVYKNYLACSTILSSQKTILNSNGAFLAYYGRVLFLDNAYGSSIQILEKAKNYSSDPLIFYTQGQNYSKIGRDIESEANLKMAINISPNRFYPRYLLLLHYIKAKKSSEAVSTAKIIIDLDEKIVSPATIEIKNRAKRYLESMNKTSDR